MNVAQQAALVASLILVLEDAPHGPCPYFDAALVAAALPGQFCQDRRADPDVFRGIKGVG